MEKEESIIPGFVKNVVWLLQTVFLVLQACDVVSWSWYVVLSPLLTTAAGWLLCAVICCVAAVNENL